MPWLGASDSLTLRGMTLSKTIPPRQERSSSAT
jgi:hypothetical protein